MAWLAGGCGRLDQVREHDDVPTNPFGCGTLEPEGPSRENGFFTTGPPLYNSDPQATASAQRLRGARYERTLQDREPTDRGRFWRVDLSWGGDCNRSLSSSRYDSSTPRRGCPSG
jgi:hypothetical protein